VFLVLLCNHIPKYITWPSVKIFLSIIIIIIIIITIIIIMTSIWALLFDTSTLYVETFIVLTVLALSVLNYFIKHAFLCLRVVSMVT
jgi:hypothetical protein